MEFISIEGNSQRLDGGAMFGNAPKVMWEKWLKPDEVGRIDLSCRAFLFSIEKQNILLETGIGAFFEPKLAERYGVQTPQTHCLRQNLYKTGFTENDIHWVILSHLHFDHAGGLLPTYEEQQKGNNKLLFPNATYVVSKEAWERALHPHPRDRASFIPGLTDKLLASGRLMIIDQEKTLPGLTEHIEFLITEGHTPGQLHTLVKKNKEKAFFCGDLIPGKAWLNPAITMGYDRFPEKLIDEKRAILQRAAQEGWILFFTHDPEVWGAQIEFSDKVSIKKEWRINP